MIVPMKRVFVVGRETIRAALLEAVRAAGVLHVEPIGPVRAPAGDAARVVERLERAIGMLEGEAVAGARPDVSAEAAAEEALSLDKARAEVIGRREAVVRQLAELEPWGDVRLSEVEALHAQGLHLTFASLPRADVGHVRADVVQELHGLPRGRVLVGVASRGGVDLPASAEVLELPATDRPTLRIELEALEVRLAAGAARLSCLRHLVGAMRERAAALRVEAEIAKVTAGALSDDVFFGLQGWVPASRVEVLQAAVAACPGVVVARDPSDDEAPPTLLRPPAWARPVSGLMEMLGLTPGYREVDVSVGFMVAVPLFAAILISDAGYGALVALAPLLVYKRAVGALGKQLTHFLVVIGVVSVIWGALTGSVFGVDVAKALTGGPPLIAISQEEGPMRLLMYMCFTIGAVHLSLAHLWRAALLWPQRVALGKVGWAMFLWGMYGVVTMFVLKAPMGWNTPWPYLLCVGAGLAVLFGAAEKGVLKSVLVGLANFPLSALSTFSDIMSYVRLMAVGLAGSVLAVSFNELAASAGVVMKVPILLFGHGLNIGLCLIALFAHGVRLNVLEFSNNFGLEWSGAAYRPYGEQTGAAPAPHEGS